jgi:uncharacterized protein YaaR (DUF327 family)
MSFGQNSYHANVTINRYIREETKAILRKRVFLAMLQSRGRITLNMSGKLVDWKVKHKRSSMSPFDDGDSIVFTRQEKHKTAQLPMRAYIVSQGMNKGDKLINAGKEAIIKKYSSMVKELLDDIRDQFAEQLVQVDGNSAGNTNRIHGLESVFSATADAASLVGTNNDTYAGLATARGTYGGGWTGTWPDGYGDSQYDFWTPLVVNYTSPLAFSSGGWSASTKTWSNTCVEALRFAIINTQRNVNDLDLFLLEKNLYRQFLDKADDSERLVVERNQDPGMTKLGFKGVNVDGVDVFWEVGLAAGTGYGLCMDELELMSWQNQLFASNSDFNLETVSDRVAIDFYGNLRMISPRALCKLKNLS